MAQLQRLSMEFDKMKLSVIEELRKEMDDRGVGGENYFNSRKVLERVQAFETKIKMELQKFIGSQYVSASNENGYAHSLNAVAGCQNPVIFEESEKSKFYLSFKQAGQICKLPENHVFPNMVLSTAISNWFCGDKSKNLAPYMFIKRRDVDRKQNKNCIAKMR